MKHLEIYDDKKIIKIKSIDDLCFLPDKSIKLLFENSSYMTTLYTYVLYTVEAYLEIKNYSTETRTEYFNVCLKHLDSFIKYENEFLRNNSTPYIIEDLKLPENMENIYKDSVISTCYFFRGILSTTPHLDTKLFPREKMKIVKHNYANMISVLLRSVGI